MSRPLCITSKREDLDQGLFGNVFLHIFHILPFLYQQKLFPAWEIRTLHYGDPPDYITIPGALDLAYTPPQGPYRTVTLNELRRRHAHLIGNDWPEICRVWNTYFRIPPRVIETAKTILPPGRVLGVHYRGTDKQTTTWDSNPITQDQYIFLVNDFLSQHSGFDVIFAATDEHSFVEKLRSSVTLPVVALGEVAFHLSTEDKVSRKEKDSTAPWSLRLRPALAMPLRHRDLPRPFPVSPSFFNPRDRDLSLCPPASSSPTCSLLPGRANSAAPCDETRRVRRNSAPDNARSDWTFEPSMDKLQRRSSPSPHVGRENHKKLFSVAERVNAHPISPQELFRATAKDFSSPSDSRIRAILSSCFAPSP